MEIDCSCGVTTKYILGGSKLTLDSQSNKWSAENNKEMESLICSGCGKILAEIRLSVTPF